LKHKAERLPNKYDSNRFEKSASPKSLTKSIKIEEKVITAKKYKKPDYENDDNLRVHIIKARNMLRSGLWQKEFHEKRLNLQVV